MLARFHASYPGIELDVADVLSDACIQQVQSGRADFALASTRAESPELRTEPFCVDDCHVVCPAGHPLVLRKRLKLEDVAPYPIIQLARSSSVRQCVEAAIYPKQLRAVMELDQLSTVAGMVKAGLGLSAVPTLTLFHFEGAGLVTLPLQAKGLRRHIILVRRQDRTLSTAARALYDALIAGKPTLAG